MSNDFLLDLNPVYMSYFRMLCSESELKVLVFSLYGHFNSRFKLQITIFVTESLLLFKTKLINKIKQLT